MRKLLNKSVTEVIIRIIVLGFFSFQFAYGQSTGNKTEIVLPLDPSIAITTLPLWDSAIPGAMGTSAEDIPTLTVFSPQPGRENGTAIVIAPGGTYLGLVSNLEGRLVADWYAAHGVTAFVLKYRLGAKYIYPVPLLDTQRAVRWVRFNHSKYHIAPNQIGMTGFSAGGHLAAMTSTSSDYKGNSNVIDPIDRLSCNPDFLVLGYPWINAMQRSKAPFIPSYQTLLKIPEDKAKVFEEKYTSTLYVTAQTPPTFIFSTTYDSVVQVRASVDFYTALTKAGVPAELHIFRHGPHGAGLGTADAALENWPVLLDQWLRDQGFLTPDSAIVPK